MSEEQLSDAERRRIIGALLDAMPRHGRDRQLGAIIRKLSGIGAVVTVTRPDAIRPGANDE